MTKRRPTTRTEWADWDDRQRKRRKPTTAPPLSLQQYLGCFQRPPRVTESSSRSWPPRTHLGAGDRMNREFIDMLEVKQMDAAHAPEVKTFLDRLTPALEFYVDLKTPFKHTRMTTLSVPMHDLLSLIVSEWTRRVLPQFDPMHLAYLSHHFMSFELTYATLKPSDLSDRIFRTKGIHGIPLPITHPLATGIRQGLEAVLQPMSFARRVEDDGDGEEDHMISDGEAHLIVLYHLRGYYRPIFSEGGGCTRHGYLKSNLLQNAGPSTYDVDGFRIHIIPSTGQMVKLHNVPATDYNCGIAVVRAAAKMCMPDMPTVWKTSYARLRNRYKFPVTGPLLPRHIEIMCERDAPFRIQWMDPLSGSLTPSVVSPDSLTCTLMLWGQHYWLVNVHGHVVPEPLPPTPEPSREVIPSNAVGTESVRVPQEEDAVAARQFARAMHTDDCSLELAQQAVFVHKRNVGLWGPGGTGKSYVIQQLHSMATEYVPREEGLHVTCVGRD